MINYFKKEERKVFSEAIVKHFPLDSIKVIRQKGPYPSDGDIEVSVEEYFEGLHQYGPTDNTLFLSGKDGWVLTIDIDTRHDTISFSYLSKSEKNYITCIIDCEFCFDPWDYFEWIRNVWVCRRPEYKLARYLYKYAKRAIIRLKGERDNENLELLKGELL